jgi:hypothetical protein
MKKFLIGVLVGCLLMMTTPVLADSILQSINVVMDSVEVQVNGEKLDANTILYNGSTYLPMRKIAEAVGKDVTWDQKTMTANIIDITGVKEGHKVSGQAIEEYTIHKFFDEFGRIDKTRIAYAVKNDDGTIYYDLFGLISEMNEIGKNPPYNMLVSQLDYNQIIFENGSDDVLIESIEYIEISGNRYIPKDYYENTILPLIK